VNCIVKGDAKIKRLIPLRFQLSDRAVAVELVEDRDIESDSVREEVTDVFGMDVEFDRTTLRLEDSQWTADVVPMKRKRSRRCESCQEEAPGSGGDRRLISN
jgi:hypothetical protein